MKLENIGRDMSKAEEDALNKKIDAKIGNATPLADPSLILRAHDIQWDINNQERLLRNKDKEIASSYESSVTDKLLDERMEIEDKLNKFKTIKQQLNPEKPEAN